MVLAIVHADDTPHILPYTKLGAEQTVFRPQLFKNEMLAWAICVRINQGRHVLGRGVHGLGMGMRRPARPGGLVKWAYGLGMCRLV
jgi:hypothetical protein